jgi:exodeoxyribonuclease VII large subunit
MTADERGQSADNPYPVRTVAMMVKDWIKKLGTVWIEGEVAQLSMRPNTSTAFITLRDPAADMSLSVTCPRDLVMNAPVKLTEGTRVIMLGRPNFFVGRGTFSLRVNQIRAVGVGELLARIDRLRKLLAAEGLFDPRLKRPIPFLPGTIGLITGRASAAEHDVVSVAEDRWPAVSFAIRNTAVQGTSTVPQVVAALRELDADPAVDVIVIARGGGSVEDLLPFSDETLCRAISACTTPIVSAIGHENDTPLVDLVADVRASTPTDAAKRVVPDVAEETDRVRRARERIRSAVVHRLDRDQTALAALRSRPVLADPASGLMVRATDLGDLRDRARRCLRHALDRGAVDVEHTRARVRALSPAATLERGYAVVQRLDGIVVRSPDDAPPGTGLRVRLARGEITATVDSDLETRRRLSP